METCKLNGVDPQRYITDMLTRLVNGWSVDMREPGRAVMARILLREG